MLHASTPNTNTEIVVEKQLVIQESEEIIEAEISLPVEETFETKEEKNGNSSDGINKRQIQLIVRAIRFLNYFKRNSII